MKEGHKAFSLEKEMTKNRIKSTAFDYINENHLLASWQCEIGCSCLKLKRYVLAKSYFITALKYFNEIMKLKIIEEKKWVFEDYAMIKKNLGIALLNNGETEEAKKRLDESLNIQLKIYEENSQEMEDTYYT